MNIPGRPLIILLGMMTIMPVGGVIWQTLQYLLGLKRLGFDVHYVEDHEIYPAMLANSAHPERDAEAAAEFLQRTLEGYDLGRNWSYHAWGEPGRRYGTNTSETERLFSRAAAVINFHGGTRPRPEYGSAPLVYFETDPVAPQIELHQKLKATEDFLEAHDAWFTFGENLGAPDCKVPVPPPRYRFHPTRQPILMDLWDSERSAGKCFTTIANWSQPERSMTLEGETYHWSKHYEFLKFIDLPQRTKQEFELALSSYTPSDRETLEGHGWRVRPALEFSCEPDTYRQYIMESRGEWTVAKDQNVRLRSGWFSDRAASYLAAGRPVVTQETGFSNVLPTGSGLFAFNTTEEILDAIDQINAKYEEHSRGAKRVAQECFSYDVVLPKMLNAIGLSVPG